MIFFVSTLLMTAAMLLLMLVGRMMQRADVPRWLETACRGNAMALALTLLYAVGLGGALQGGFEAGGFGGLAWTLITLFVPLLVLAVAARLTRPAGSLGAERPLRPGGRPSPHPQERRSRASMDRAA